jgi:hypothetical protein
MKIGITERGDAGLDLGWKPWVESGKPAILISKNPGKLIPHLNKNSNVIVHCTITGFGGTILEPNVPNYMDALKDAKLLEELIGPSRIVIRIDPIILTIKGKARAYNVWETGMTTLKTNRYRISFMDNYPHVQERFQNAGMPALYNGAMHAPLQERMEFWERLRKPEICGEPNMPCTGCVSVKDMQTFGITGNTSRKGQRPVCCCVAEKTELLTNCKQCGHGCLYCYWR